MVSISENSILLKARREEARARGRAREAGREGERKGERERGRNIIKGLSSM